MESKNSLKHWGSNLLQILALSFFLLAYSLTIHGQYIKHKFDRITVKDGLGAPTVYHSMQDKNGFMWFATSNGISKFDGYSFTNYIHNPENPNGLSGGTNIFLLEDNEGKIWIVNNASSGLDRYDPVYDNFDNFKNDTNNPGTISSNSIYHLVQDDENNIWVATGNGISLVKKTDNDSISFDSFPNPQNVTNYFSRIHINKDGVMILFSSNVYYFDRETLSYIPSGIYFPTHQIISVTEDKEGNIYLGSTSSGTFMLNYDPDKKTYSLDEENPVNFDPGKRGFVLADDQDNIWVGTSSRGLFKYNTPTNETINFLNDEFDKSSISENTVHSLFIDKTGILWVGTVNQGLCKYDLNRKKFYHYKSLKNDSNSLSDNFINALCSTSNNELWAGMDGEYGINHVLFEGDNSIQVVRYKNDPLNENSIASNRTSCMANRRNGEIWAGGKSTKLTQIIPQTFNTADGYEIIQHSVNGWTFSLFEDSDGILWGGTWGAGLFRFNDSTKRLTYFLNDPDDTNSLCDNVAWSIYEDAQKNLWIGGNSNGLSILPANQKLSDKPEFINFSFEKNNPTSLSSNTISYFLLDSKKNMWIGTNRGLNLVLNSSESIKQIQKNRHLDFKVFNSSDGLADNGIAGIVEDKSNNLWISTNNGISLFNLSDTTFLNYHASDGLQSDEFARNATLINLDGRIFMGGKNGITAFWPQDIKANPYEPNIVLTNFKLFNKTVNVGDEINKDIVLEKSINELSEIVLSHKNNVFTIEFAALHYVEPELNQHIYYLEGFENDWNYNNVRSATYTNLYRGKYIFHVKGTNNNGKWSQTEKSIVIRVKPPWYGTWLFRIIVFIGIVLAYRSFVKTRMRRQKQEKQMLQEKIDADEHELQTRKDEIEKQKLEIEEQKNLDFELRYQQSGISKFASIIAANRENINELSNNLISELVNYTDTNSGIIYLADETDPENIILKKSAVYCHDSEDISGNEFIPGEGYVGTCFIKREILQFDDLPEGYIVLRSALGSTSLKHNVLVPIVQDDHCLGVFELASISSIQAYKVDLISNLSESFASVIAINTANTKTQEMLVQNKIQSEELAAQEEELRQNLEEMQATQDELRRQMESSEQAKNKIIFEKTLTDSLLKNAPEKIYFKDLESRFIKASNSLKNIFNTKNVEDIYGKTDFDYFTEDHAKPAFDDEQNIIKTGKPIIDKIEKETHTDGRITYVSTTKLPLKNSEGEIIGTFGISKDITELMKLKETVDNREKEMSKKEEQIIELQELIKKKETIIKELEEKLKK